MFSISSFYRYIFSFWLALRLHMRLINLNTCAVILIIVPTLNFLYNIVFHLTIYQMTRLFQCCIEHVPVAMFRYFACKLQLCNYSICIYNCCQLEFALCSFLYFKSERNFQKQILVRLLHLTNKLIRFYYSNRIDLTNNGSLLIHIHIFFILTNNLIWFVLF